MSKDLQIIKKLKNKFSKLGFFEYELNSDKVTVIKLKLNSKILSNPRKHYVTNKDLTI